MTFIKRIKNSKPHLFNFLGKWTQCYLEHNENIDESQLKKWQGA